MTTAEEKRLQKIREQISQMKSKETAIMSREKSRQRKEKTRRLIQIGALTEKLLTCERLPLPEVEKILQQIFNVPGVLDFVEDMKKSLG